jgi:serine protease inhibitor
MTQVLSAQSEKPRIAQPDVPEADLDELTTANRVFAFDLFRALRVPNRNPFFSPHSISVALAMTYAGACSLTAEEIAGTLHFTLPPERLHAAFNALQIELASRTGDAVQPEDSGTGSGSSLKERVRLHRERPDIFPDPEDDGRFRLSIVNAMWAQAGYNFLDSFLDTLAENYDAGLQLLDFIRAPEPSRVTINDWVAEQTKDRIQDLIPQGAIDSLTRLVLTNAIYFKARWEETFSEALTHDENFHLLDGAAVSVPMMHQTADFGYAAGEGVQAVEMAYEGRELSMLVLLPDAGTFDAFEKRLDTGVVDQLTEQVRIRELVLTMPKFEFDADFMLSQTLADMGMPAAFSDDADFSAITGARDLIISDVIHKAFVAVDEKGTEAAAATAVIFAERGMPFQMAEPLVVTIDRPFVFLIRDRKTGTILFAGRVLDPGS